MPERTTEPDGKVTYTCRLKHDIHYHKDPCFPGGTGREVVAEDVHYAWLRMCDPKVECPILSTLDPVVIGMHDLYEAAKKAGRMDYSARLPGLEVVDSAQSFKIHLSEPYPQIVFWLAMQFTTPASSTRGGGVLRWEGASRGEEKRRERNSTGIQSAPVLLEIAEYQGKRTQRFRLTSAIRTITPLLSPTGRVPAGIILKRRNG